MAALRTGTDDQQVRLVGVARIANVAGDHLQPGVASQKPAADALHPAERLHAVADMNPHLRPFVHERHRSLAVAGQRGAFQHRAAV